MDEMEYRIKKLQKLVKWPVYTETTNRVRQKLANELQVLEKLQENKNSHA